MSQYLCSRIVQLTCFELSLVELIDCDRRIEDDAIDSSLAAAAVCGHRAKDAEDEDVVGAGDGQPQEENVNTGDDTAELMHIRQTLRTFTHNKHKLKYAAWF